MNQINGNLLPMLFVSNIRKSIDYYCNQLKFEFKGWWDDDKSTYVQEWEQQQEPEFAEIVAGNLIIHLHKGDDSKNVSSLVLHLEVEDVDQYYQDVTGAGIQADGPRNMPWGWRQFYVQDPDGHQWSFRNPTKTGIMP